MYFKSNKFQGYFNNLLFIKLNSAFLKWKYFWNSRYFWNSKFFFNLQFSYMRITFSCYRIFILKYVNALHSSEWHFLDAFSLLDDTLWYWITFINSSFISVMMILIRAKAVCYVHNVHNINNMHITKIRTNITNILIDKLKLSWQNLWNQINQINLIDWS